MFSNSKTRKSIAATRIRRSGLAALLISCGAVSATLANDTPEATQVPQMPQQAHLHALPPLPVGIQQLQPSRNGASKNGGTRFSTPAPVVRSNPFANTSTDVTAHAGTEAVVRRVGGTTPIKTTGNHPATGAQQAPARLMRTTNPVISLKRVNNAGTAELPAQAVLSPTGSAPVADPLTQLPTAQLGPPQPAAATWVAPMPAPMPAVVLAPTAKPIAVGSMPSNVLQNSEAAIENQHQIDVVVVDNTASSTSFSLSDRDDSPLAEVGDNPAGDLPVSSSEASDQIVILEGSAELLQVGRPKLLTAAAPLMLDGDAAKQAQHGDVRASGAPRTIRDSDSAAVAAAPINFAELPEVVNENPYANDDATSDSGDLLSVARSAIPLPRPMSLEEVEQIEQQDDEPILAMAPLTVEQPNLPVPQVYRPKQSLVIDVPVAKPSPVETVSNDKVILGNAEDSLFAGAVSEVLPITVAQSYAHVPSDAVRRVQLEDRDVCEAVLVGAHKLLLIGRREGSTRLAIWCGDATEPTLYEIQVGVGTQATTGSSLEAIATRLSETITATYPRCRVRVVTQGEGLAVVGQATDAKSAREILRLVRSACLKSVNDQLVVR